MSTRELLAKFEDCACRALAHDQIKPLFERLGTLESVADLGQVTSLLEARAAEPGGLSHHQPSQAGEDESAFRSSPYSAFSSVG
jgi:hypothetical protein